MSAFFCEDITIHRAVVAYYSQSLFDINSKDATITGRAMLSLNHQAMCQRYPQIVGTVEEAEYLVAVESYVFRVVIATPGQYAMSLNCLLYQCSEGDIPETSFFYKTLSEISERIGEPEGYAQAEWN